jgi:hypothetical protein
VVVLMVLTMVSALSAPLLAASFDSSSNLAACCRTGGKHHCMMRERMGRELLNQPGRHFSAPFEKCPFFPTPTPPVTTQIHVLALPQDMMFQPALFAHGSCRAQVEAQRHFAFSRSRQKRGPPASQLS